MLPAGHDVGVVMARAPLGSPPIGVNTAQLPAQIDAARLVGYGLTNPGAEEPEGGVRRVLPVRVRRAGTRFIELDDAEGRACAGDSGGPVLARLVDGGPEVVVGIVSYGDTGCRRGTQVTNLATYAGYLRDFITRDAITPQRGRSSADGAARTDQGRLMKAEMLRICVVSSRFLSAVSTMQRSARRRRRHISRAMFCTTIT